MEVFTGFIIFVASAFISFICILIKKRFDIIRDFEKLISIFLKYYKKYERVLDSDCSAEEIWKKITKNSHSKKYKPPTQLKIALGDSISMEFKDSSGMRKAFLYAGEFIFNYEEKMFCGNKPEEVMFNPEKYQEFLKCLIQVRTIAFSKNEETRVCLK